MISFLASHTSFLLLPSLLLSIFPPFLYLLPQFSVPFLPFFFHLFISPSFLVFILKEGSKLNNYFSVVHYTILAFGNFLFLIVMNKKILCFYENIDSETNKHFLQIILRKSLVSWSGVIHFPDLYTQKVIHVTFQKQDILSKAKHDYLFQLLLLNLPEIFHSLE